MKNITKIDLKNLFDSFSLLLFFSFQFIDIFGFSFVDFISVNLYKRIFNKTTAITRDCTCLTLTKYETLIKIRITLIKRVLFLVKKKLAFESFFSKSGNLYIISEIKIETIDIHHLFRSFFRQIFNPESFHRFENI